tara:strand:+ start:1134 stop:1376 length:243 start_codon:yes stop_codon:yes gene_type:complete
MQRIIEMAMKKSKMATKKKMAAGKKTKMSMRGGKKTKMAMKGGKKTKMAMKGGKKTKMAANSTTARGSRAARPQTFRKNG